MQLGQGNQPAVVTLNNCTHAKRRCCVGVHGDVLQVRTKVFKCLGAIVEADSRIMMMPEVAQAVNAAQEDDSAAVKEAVLELLVKLIGTNPELAGQYFDTLVQASYVSAEHGYVDLLLHRKDLLFCACTWWQQHANKQLCWMVRLWRPGCRQALALHCNSAAMYVLLPCFTGPRHISAQTRHPCALGVLLLPEL